jgi:hypothetical protein
MDDRSKIRDVCETIMPPWTYIIGCINGNYKLREFFEVQGA